MKDNHLLFIDYLKVIGLFLIILAHVCDNDVIMQLRSFDVPLMVFISGYLAYDSYSRSLQHGKSIFDYYKKRILRLYVPTAIFLTIYFIVVKIGTFNTEYPHSLKQIIESYLLLDGIGYVWIIRVYLLCAFIVPVIFYFNNKIKDKKIKLLLVIFIYIMYELFVKFGFNETNLFFKHIISYIIPYGSIYILGMVNRNYNDRQNKVMIVLSLILFVLSFIVIYLQYGEIKMTSFMKYPPRIYYLSYALFVTYLLIYILKKIKLNNNRIIRFVSSSSLWIYLWHILFINFIAKFMANINWICKYVIVLLCAILITYLQNCIVNILEKKNFNKSLLKLFRG